MSRVSVPLSWNDFGSFIAEANALVNVRKGCVVIAGTALNQVKPLAYNASADSTAVIGIAQEDADAGQPVRVALPGQIGMHRVAKFVRQRAQARHVVGETHHDEGVGARCACGEGALPLAQIGIHVHPALLQTTSPQGLDVLRA